MEPIQPLASSSIMKHTFRPPFLLVAAPLCALTLLSPAQTPAPAGADQTPSAVTLPQDLHASGLVSSFDASGLTVLTPATGSMTVYLTNSDTMFVDKQDQFIAPDRIIPQTPVTVHYTPVGNMIVATKVVVTSTPFSNGTLIEVSPGVLVVETPGAATAPMRYINNTATTFVDEKGDPVAARALRPGASVRIFYTKEGDTLVASKVQVMGPASTGVSTQSTTTTREIKR